jgi:hypothetical protein
MRLTLRLLGIEVFHVSTDAEPGDDKSRDLSGGVCASTPINVAWRPGQGIDHESESPYEDE